MKKGDSESLSDRRTSLHCAIRNLLSITLQVQMPGRGRAGLQLAGTHLHRGSGLQHRFSLNLRMGSAIANAVVWERRKGKHALSAEVHHSSAPGLPCPPTSLGSSQE